MTGGQVVDVAACGSPTATHAASADKPPGLDLARPDAPMNLKRKLSRNTNRFSCFNNQSIELSQLCFGRRIIIICAQYHHDN